MGSKRGDKRRRRKRSADREPARTRRAAHRRKGAGGSPPPAAGAQQRGYVDRIEVACERKHKPAAAKEPIARHGEQRQADQQQRRLCNAGVSIEKAAAVPEKAEQILVHIPDNRRRWRMGKRLSAAFGSQQSGEDGYGSKELKPGIPVHAGEL